MGGACEQECGGDGGAAPATSQNESSHDYRPPVGDRFPLSSAPWRLLSYDFLSGSHTFVMLARLDPNGRKAATACHNPAFTSAKAQSRPLTHSIYSQIHTIPNDYSFRSD